MNARSLKHKELTDKIIKGFYEVYNELGYGFLESVYERALNIVFESYGLQVERQKDIAVHFRTMVIGEYRADLVVEDTVIVEIKAGRALAPEHEAQVMNYLRATNIEIGFLVNFGQKPEFKRFVYDNERKSISGNLCKSVAEKL
ncbi:MAG: GxxExxY protein [Nitrospirae bacterium]|nr:GxxExxY protein [Nitrospirota bacterium]